MDYSQRMGHSQNQHTKLHRNTVSLCRGKFKVKTCCSDVSVPKCLQTFNTIFGKVKSCTDIRFSLSYSSFYAESDSVNNSYQ